MTEVSGANLILTERLRQISMEGYKPEHDDQHDREELLEAAIAYINESPEQWPWENQWKPSGDRIRDLTKAGALIAAEIDRLQRVQAKKSPELIEIERALAEATKQIQLLQKTIQNLRQEAHDKEHPPTWGYDG
jgi:chromosome segregation ATPase